MSGNLALTMTQPMIVRVDRFAVEYRLARHQVTGEWVAVGGAHELNGASHALPVILAGIGASPDDAVDDLLAQLERKIAHLGETSMDR